jgi:hypothetical protein
VVVAIKSKGGDCWHYDTSVVLDGNSLRGWYRCSEVGTGDGNLIRGQILVQQVHKKVAYTRRFIKEVKGSYIPSRVYTQVGFSKSAYMWKTTFGPWRLVLGSCAYGFGPWCLDGRVDP